MLNKKEKDINDAYHFTYVYVMLDLKGGAGGIQARSTRN